MRRATAVRRLRAIAERCQQVCALWEPQAGLVGVQAFGAVLDPADEDPSIEVIQIALILNVEPDEVPWCSRPATFSGLPYVLDLEKAPVDWYFRPLARLVGNHRIVRPLPIWSRQDGVHGTALAALAGGDAEALDRLREPQPRPAVLQRQLSEELASAAAHLQRVRDQYWARGWRKGHHAAGTYPENHLWDAVNGYLDLLGAVGGAPGSAQETAAAAVRAVAGPVEQTGPERGDGGTSGAGPRSRRAEGARAGTAGAQGVDEQSALPVDPWGPPDGEPAEDAGTPVNRAGAAGAGRGRHPRRRDHGPGRRG